MTDAEVLSPPADHSPIERLRAIMHRLRAPGGCSWDAEQTHQSLISNLIEEAYETVDAIQEDDKSHLCEELGDLLLQVVFHAEIASETDTFDFDAVATGICEKLIRRHPHVYGARVFNPASPKPNSTQPEPSTLSTAQVLTQWDEIKRQERGTLDQPYLHDTGKGLPAILRAAKLQKKAAKVGFDWPDAHGILDKIQEELDETREALSSGDRAEIEAEVGDLLFVVTNLARKLKIDPEAAIERTNQKFLRRFGHIETSLQQQDTTLAEASLEQMEALWIEAKSLQ